MAIVIVVKKNPKGITSKSHQKSEKKNVFRYLLNTRILKKHLAYAYSDHFYFVNSGWFQLL